MDFMKRIATLVLILAAATSLFAGCMRTSAGNGGVLSQSGNTAEKVSIVCTIFPGYDFARAVAGDLADITMLMPPGAESHSFEPTPRDIITIQNCDVFIYVGGDSDTWVKEILGSMDTSAMTVLSMMDIVDVVEEEIKEGMQTDDGHEHDHDHEHSHSEDEHGDSEYDEHVWTSPVNAARITQAVADTLCALDADSADIYKENTAAYIEALNALDAALRAVVRDAARSTLIFGDRFPFRYLVDEYGLDYYAAFPGCSSDTQANAKTVAFLIDQVRAEKIPVVFTIEFSNGKMADTICEATGAKKLLLHSCHNVTRDEIRDGVTYLSLMTRNIDHLKEALN
jgi:zinc transport system substrate-binding protein